MLNLRPHIVNTKIAWSVCYLRSRLGSRPHWHECAAEKFRRKLLRFCTTFLLGSVPRVLKSHKITLIKNNDRNIVQLTTWTRNSTAFLPLGSSPPLLFYISAIGLHGWHPRSPGNVDGFDWRNYFNSDRMSLHGVGRLSQITSFCKFNTRQDFNSRGMTVIAKKVLFWFQTFWYCCL